MTNERRLLMSLDEIKALVFECNVNDCGARISIRPEKIEGIPTTVLADMLGSGIR